MKKYMITSLLVVIFIVALIGLVKINIVNTEVLSPLGNTNYNFNIVSKEFGEDFAEFIKDNSPIKIYIGEKGDKEATIRILNKDINLTLNNPFIKAVEPVFNFIDDKVDSIKEKVNKNNEKDNTNNKGNKEDIDKIVDDFIDQKDESNNN